MHAPVVLQHYLVAMTNQQRIPMLDMVSYLRKKMPAKTLYNHIWENEGGSSLSFLKIILHDKPMATEMEFFKGKNLLTANLASNLEDYGPALISNFQVSSQFKDMNQWQHLGKDDGKILGSHAMVLVGYRIVNGQVRYLVQNWWKQKAYIEVDASYLANCDATITFFLKKQTQMGDFDSNHEALVECDADACEQQELEGSEIN
ncbi:hypothetical protein ROZALSC1DRAFT_30572 [Rozella allomycis CSF55]|uniref:Uncharacterized protein n=1 Tax=Rozella allomycis (strain CSF55) TaxID=988480 RepID=A0A075AS57_ROZAC|nr:hypothetical protein O9G_000027 [Rozella allomycis CSF55]RKP17655.1 hypothetical protein ROZALSC1DRAFT_30572 [Rozella allomycis CSF55]|eukprot:EPZ31551.1 hypothetical protein O9G_000027 [Rozella allomycis CSF55]